MNGLFLILMALAMLAVLASLGLGLVALARGGEFSQKYSNKFMRLRVVFQGVALILFALALMSGT